MERPIVSEVVSVHLPFLLINVVRIESLPSGLFQPHAHETDAGEEFSDCPLVFHTIPYNE